MLKIFSNITEKKFIIYRKVPKYFGQIFHKKHDQKVLKYPFIRKPRDLSFIIICLGTQIYCLTEILHILFKIN